MSRLRPINPLPLAGFLPADLKGVRLPKIMWVNPTDLVVEEEYQRNLSRASGRMITKIVKNWDWARMKPPICAEAPDGKYFVMDGQHTAIAAATHPDIKEIPIMVIPDLTIRQRASSFIGHNSDNIRVSTMQIHFAALAAGDGMAKNIQSVCDKVGVRILKQVAMNNVYGIGDTVACVTMANIIRKHGISGLEQVLKLLVETGAAPVSSIQLIACARLLFDKQYEGYVDAYDLTTIIQTNSMKDWNNKAQELRAETGLPLALAMAEVWFTSLPSQQKRKVSRG